MGSPYTAVFLSFELTSPFIMTLKCFEDVNMATFGNPFFVLTAFGTATSWVVVRLGGGSLLVWLSYDQWNDLWEARWARLSFLMSFVVFFNYINFYWFYRMMRKAQRIVNKTDKRHSM